MNKEFLELLEKSKKIHEAKNQDYTSGNVDENFERMAIIQSWFNNPLDKAFAGMVAVKLARLATLLNKSTTPKHESVDDSFLDLFTYVGLWAANYQRRYIKGKLDLFFNMEALDKTVSPIKDLEWSKHSTDDIIENGIKENTEMFIEDIEYMNKNSKLKNPTHQKILELVQLRDHLTDADYAQILSTARILVMRKS